MLLSARLTASGRLDTSRASDNRTVTQEVIPDTPPISTSAVGP
jgi:hypothetical protein